LVRLAVEDGDKEWLRVAVRLFGEALCDADGVLECDLLLVAVFEAVGVCEGQMAAHGPPQSTPSSP